jgi:hypothetical protein
MQHDSAHHNMMNVQGCPQPPKDASGKDRPQPPKDANGCPMPPKDMNGKDHPQPPKSK